MRDYCYRAICATLVVEKKLIYFFLLPEKKKQRNSKFADQGRVVQSGLDALKIIKKTIRLNVFEQNINKPGLEFNLGVALIVLRTGPGVYSILLKGLH